MGFAQKLYSFIARPVPGPATGNLAFVQNTSLPEVDLRGSGRPVYNQFSAFAPQIIAAPTVKLDGYGGLFTGQYVSQPLLEPKRNGIS